MAMQNSSDNMTERNRATPSGGLTPIRGVVLVLVITGACELFFIGINKIMARLLGH